MTALILRNDSSLSIQFTETAAELKENALNSAALIGRVSNAEEQEEAVKAQTALTKLCNDVEAARKICKEPVLDFGRLIDAKAKAFVDEVKIEQMRIAKLIGDFQALEAARVRAAEAAKRAELEEIERRRQQALAEAKTHEQREAVEERCHQEIQALPTVKAARVEGQRVEEVWEVTVNDVWSLLMWGMANNHRGVVKVEAALGEIKALLKMGIRPHGIHAEKVVKASVKLPRETKAIEV